MRNLKTKIGKYDEDKSNHNLLQKQNQYKDPQSSSNSYSDFDKGIYYNKINKFLYQSDDFIINKTNCFDVSISPSLVRSNQQNSDQKMWVYFIILTNFGTDSYKLISRKLLIKDGYKQIQEISGTGVVGLNPIIDPRSSFEYCSHIMVDSHEALLQISFVMQNLLTLQNIVIESKEIVLADFEKIISH
jgi:ApaG protein